MQLGTLILRAAAVFLAVRIKSENKNMKDIKTKGK
jgi:isoprenylcysteine carboxyl methyltransferase (ICMT) family protein YpbQ